jgi:hypothetical protein
MDIEGFNIMSESKHYQANPVVSCGEEEDGAVLFNPDTDDTAILNFSGQMIWKFLEQPRTVEEMIDFLAKEYPDVSIEQATEDVNQFVEALKPDFLIEEGNIA